MNNLSLCTDLASKSRTLVAASKSDYVHDFSQPKLNGANTSWLKSYIPPKSVFENDENKLLPSKVSSTSLFEITSSVENPFQSSSSSSSSEPNRSKFSWEI